MGKYKNKLIKPSQRFHSSEKRINFNSNKISRTLERVLEDTKVMKFSQSQPKIKLSKFKIY